MCVEVFECEYVCKFGSIKEYEIMITLNIYLRLVMISVTASPFFPVSIFRQIVRFHLVFLFPFFAPIYVIAHFAT